MSTISITGHRPENIDDMKWVREKLREAYLAMDATKVIQGMAAGVDLWSAAEAWNSKIPFVAVKPWAGHAPRNADKKAYDWVIANAVEVLDVSPALTYPGLHIYQKRNEFMVDRAEAVLAVWDGNPRGGTFNCFQYALQTRTPIYRIDPKRKIVRGWIDMPDATVL